jgi:hypothetical protein
MVKKLGIGMRSREGCIDRIVKTDRYNNKCIDIENIHTKDFNYFRSTDSSLMIFARKILKALYKGRLKHQSIFKMLSQAAFDKLALCC